MEIQQGKKKKTLQKKNAIPGTDHNVPSHIYVLNKLTLDLQITTENCTNIPLNFPDKNVLETV